MELIEPEDIVYAYPNWDILGVEECNQTVSPTNFAADGPTSIYLHVPYCVSLCQFCGFTKSPHFSNFILDEYVKNVLLEMDILCDRFDIRGRTIEALYFGGGTPSVLSPKHIGDILDGINKRFHLRHNSEMSLEGECQTLNRRGYLDEIKPFGFHRISYGVQTLEAGYRAALNLKPATQDLADLAMRAANICEDVIVDFIFGWPGQDEEHAIKDVLDVCDTIPASSIEIFQFERGDASPKFLAELARAGIKELPLGVIRSQRRGIADALASRGFNENSFTMFSKPNDKITSREFTYGSCFYGFKNGNVLGFGRGAQSFYRGIMWSNGAQEKKHGELLAEGSMAATVCSTYRDHEREAITWPRRMWIERSTIDQFNNDEYSRNINGLIEGGYIYIDGSKIRLTSKGVKKIPSLIDLFLPADQKKLYDRDVEYCQQQMLIA